MAIKPNEGKPPEGNEDLIFKIKFSKRKGHGFGRSKVKDDSKKLEDMVKDFIKRNKGETEDEE